MKEKACFTSAWLKVIGPTLATSRPVAKHSLIHIPGVKQEGNLRATKCRA